MKENVAPKRFIYLFVGNKQSILGRFPARYSIITALQGKFQKSILLFFIKHERWMNGRVGDVYRHVREGRPRKRL